MRTFLATSFTAILVTAIAIAGLKAARLPVHLPAAMIALGVTLAASAMAGLPLLLVDRSSALARAQASLGSTIIHLMVMTAGGGIVILGKFSPDAAFVYWLAVLYVSTLIALVASIIRGIQATAMEGK